MRKLPKCVQDTTIKKKKRPKKGLFGMYSSPRSDKMYEAIELKSTVPTISTKRKGPA